MDGFILGSRPYSLVFQHFFVKKQRTTNNILRAERGFTLVELIVVTAIILIVSGVVIFSARDSERSLRLQRSAQITTQTVNEAINNVLGSKEHDGSVSQGGYGVRLQEGESAAVLFADCDADNAFDSGGSAASCFAASTSTDPYPEEVRQRSLEENVTISAISPCSGSPCALDIVFIPPDPRTIFTPNLPAGTNEASITLINAEGNTTTVFVNKAGVTRIE